MTALTLLFVTTLAVPGGPSVFVASAAEPAAEPALDEAERLFSEGLARYDSADYEGAIEAFTLALSEVREQGVDDFRVLGPLLYNIGRARVHAHEIDRNVEHLRQAEAIFTRFLDGAKEHPDEVDEADEADARAQLEELQARLEELEAEEGTDTTAGPGPASNETAAQVARARRLGAGLTVGGLALIGGGVGMLVWGGGYVPAAESQVAGYEDLGLPPTHPVFDASAVFIADERRKGTAWMAAGGVVGVVGLVGLAAGVSQLVKARRGERSAPTLGATGIVGPRGASIGVFGRF